MISLSLDSRLALSIEAEAKRQNVSRSEILNELIKIGLDYLGKKQALSFYEIDFETASIEEILQGIKRLSRVYQVRKTNNQILSTSTKS